jgi:hypothetical protein
MKQTAVEWLMNEIYRMDRKVSIVDLIEQAKEIEKEQQLALFKAGHLYAGCEHGFEEYYNETFN